MRCVVFGATGYLGARLVPELLSAGHEVRVMARTPAKLDDVPWRQSVEVVEGDVTDVDTVRRALDGQQVLYYLVHSMLGANFVDVDARGASIVADAAAQAGLSRIVYVGRHHPRSATVVRPFGVARRSGPACCTIPAFPPRNCGRRSSSERGRPASKCCGT